MFSGSLTWKKLIPKSLENHYGRCSNSKDVLHHFSEFYRLYTTIPGVMFGYPGHNPPTFYRTEDYVKDVPAVRCYSTLIITEF
jgi:hypothetical protein